MARKTFATLIASSLVLSAPLAAQEASPDPSNEIVVEGVREREQAVETMTRAITRRARYDKPISKFYSQVCFGVMGMKADYARTLIARMEETAREIDVPVGGDGCLVNVLVAFVRDGATNLDALREAEPKLFATLLDYEYDRIKLGNGAVQAWHGTHLKGKDGREFTYVKTPDGREMAVNSQYSSSRLTNQVRVEMTGAIIVIDSERVPGKTLQQLADYAAMRTFVSINDTTGGGVAGIPTILSLFDDELEAPQGLTIFDRAYLETVYRLPATANDAQIHDATWTMYRRLERRFGESGAD